MLDYDLFGRRCEALYVTPFLDENLLKEDFTGPGPILAWYTQDGLGSVRQLVVGERVLNSYAYTAWGVPLRWRERICNRYTYTGREWNAETGVYHYRARTYNPATGAFAARDPNNQMLYAYTVNCPTRFIDPFGTHVFSGAVKASQLARRKEDVGWWIPRIRLTIRYWASCLWRRRQEAQVGSQSLQLMLRAASESWKKYGIDITFVRMNEKDFAHLVGEKEEAVKKRGFTLMIKHVEGIKRSKTPFVLFVTRKALGVTVRNMPIGYVPAGSGKPSWVAVITGFLPGAVRHELWHTLSGSDRDIVWHPVTHNTPPSLQELRMVWERMVKMGSFVSYEPNDCPLTLYIDAFKRNPHTDPSVTAVKEWIEHELEYWRERARREQEEAMGAM